MEDQPAIAFTDDLSAMHNSAALEDIPRTYEPNPERYFEQGGAGTILIIRNFRYPVAKDYTKHAVFEFCEKMNKSLTALNDPFKKDDSWNITAAYPEGTTLNPLPDYSSFFDQALYHGSFVAHKNRLTGTLMNNNELCPNYQQTKEINIDINEIKRISDGALDSSLHELPDGELSNVEIEIAAFRFKKGLYEYNLPGMGPIGSGLFKKHLSGAYIYKDNIKVTMDGIADPFLTEFHYSTKRGDLFRLSVCMICVNLRKAGNEGLKQGHSRVFFEPSKERSALTAAVREASRQLHAFAKPIPDELPIHLLPPKLMSHSFKGEMGESIDETIHNTGGPVTNIAWELPLELASSDLKLLAKGENIRLVGTYPETEGSFTIEAEASNDFGECAFRFTIKTQKPLPPHPPPPPSPPPPPPGGGSLGGGGSKGPALGGTWANAHPDEHRELTAIATQLQSFVVVNERPNLEMLRDQLQKLQELIRSFETGSGPS